MSLATDQVQQISATDPQACPANPHARSFNPYATPNFADLYPLLAQARDEAPVLYSQELHMWVVSRHADALTILRDPDTFSSSTRPVILSQFVDEAREILETTHTFTAPNFAFDANPDHDRLRRPIAGYFSARGVAQLEPRIRKLAQQQLARMPAEPPIELNSTYARPLANKVILDIAGLPLDEYDRLMRYHDGVAAFFFGAPPPETQVGYARDAKEFEDYLADFVARRRAEPGDDLTSYLLQKVDNGQADYTEAEIISFLAFDVVTAGIRPTAFALSNLCRELLEHRHYWELLRENAALFDSAFSESLRHSAMSLGVFRQTTADAEVSGTVIPAGSLVWVMICSASQDERQFPSPGTFNPLRQNLSSSLHFSHGLHYCLGSSLARTVTRVGLDLLMRRHPDLHLVPDQTIEYEPSMNLTVPAQLLVEW